MQTKALPLLLGMILLPVASKGATITDTIPAGTFTVNETMAGDHITIVSGPIVSGFQTIDVTSTFFDTIELANKTLIVVNDVPGGSSITVNFSIPSTGLAGLTVNGGTGADLFTVTPSASIPITINGGGNPQPPPGNVLTVLLSGTTGANLTSTNSATGLHGAWTFTNRQPVNFAGIETITLPSAVPEPGVLPILAAGLAGLVLTRIRFKRASWK